VGMCSGQMESFAAERWNWDPDFRAFVILWRVRLLQRRPDLDGWLDFPKAFELRTTGGVGLASWLLDMYEQCAKEEEWKRERRLAYRAGIL
jgi:hypothetical protein